MKRYLLATLAALVATPAVAATIDYRADLPVFTTVFDHAQMEPGPRDLGARATFTYDTVDDRIENLLIDIDVLDIAEPFDRGGIVGRTRVYHVDLISTLVTGYDPGSLGLLFDYCHYLAQPQHPDFPSFGGAVQIVSIDVTDLSAPIVSGHYRGNVGVNWCRESQTSFSNAITVQDHPGWTATASVVPECTAGGLLMVAAAGLLLIRRRT